MSEQKETPPRCQPGTGNEESSQREVIISGPHGKLPFIPAWLDDADLVGERRGGLSGGFTTGPWSLRKTPKCYAVDSVRGTITLLARGCSSEDEGNASLIAAAPDLLEALECLLGVSMLRRLDSQDQEVIDAKAAISKARGKEAE